MSQSTVVQAKDLDINCLLPKRYLGRCFECQRFENKRGERCPSAIVPREVQRYLDHMETIERERERNKNKWEMLEKYERQLLEEKLGGPQGSREDGTIMEEKK